MNKIVIPALLVATIIIAGAFAFAPVEQASTLHLEGTIEAASIVPSGSAAVNIATTAGDPNVITVGNAADPDTITLNGDTTIVGDTTIGSGTADTFNWASAGGDTYNFATGIGIDTVNIGTDVTAVDIINIGDSTARVGFFGVSATQQTAPNIITGNIGTGDNALVDITDPSAGDEAGAINDNFSDLQDEINAIRLVLVNLGLAA